MPLCRFSRPTGVIVGDSTMGIDSGQSLDKMNKTEVWFHLCAYRVHCLSSASRRDWSGLSTRSMRWYRLQKSKCASITTYSGIVSEVNNSHTEWTQLVWLWVYDGTQELTLIAPSVKSRTLRLCMESQIWRSSLGNEEIFSLPTIAKLISRDTLW